MPNVDLHPKLNVSLPDDLYKAVKREARLRGLSMRQVVIRACWKDLEARQKARDARKATQP